MVLELLVQEWSWHKLFKSQITQMGNGPEPLGVVVQVLGMILEWYSKYWNSPEPEWS